MYLQIYKREVFSICVNVTAEEEHGKLKPYTLDAVQVWSVGKNKIDDDGLDFNLPEDMKRKIYWRDDIRIIIPLPKNDVK